MLLGSSLEPIGSKSFNLASQLTSTLRSPTCQCGSLQKGEGGKGSDLLSHSLKLWARFAGERKCPQVFPFQQGEKRPPPTKLCCSHQVTYVYHLQPGNVTGPKPCAQYWSLDEGHSFKALILTWKDSLKWFQAFVCVCFNWTGIFTEDSNSCS